MKTEIVKTDQKEIDWSKPMVVKFKTSDLFILTDGEHRGGIFSGIVIYGDDRYTVSLKSIEWSKSSFSPITEPVTITFYPNED